MPQALRQLVRSSVNSNSHRFLIVLSNVFNIVFVCIPAENNSD